MVELNVRRMGLQVAPVQQILHITSKTFSTCTSDVHMVERICLFYALTDMAGP